MNLRHDLRDAVRSLRKSPGFTVTAIATLAVALGANTAIFTVVDATLLRGLPYRDPGSLVLLWGNVERQRVERRGASFPDFVDWRGGATRSFAGMAAYWDDAVTLYGEGEPRQLAVEVVSASYFELLGVGPAHGRLFDAGDDEVGAPAAIVLGHDFWQERYGGDPAVLGRVLRLGETPSTVVGVLPAGFVGLSGDADAWLAVGSQVAGQASEARGRRWFPALARLRPGVSLETAQAEVTAVARRLAATYPDTNEKRGVEVAPLADELLGGVRPHLELALAAVGVVLLLAAANVAGLSLARADARGREIAIRRALGAGRGSLARRQLVEGLVVAAAAAACGGLLAGWLTEALLAASPVALPAFVEVAPNRLVFLFALAVTTALGLFLGLAPLTRIRAAGGAAALRAGTERAIGARSVSRLRQALVVAEVALAMALLAAAGLLLRSLHAITAVDPGFRPAGVLVFEVQLPPRPEGEAGAATALQVVDRLGALPGVEAAALSSDLPYGPSSALLYTVEGQADAAVETTPRAYWHRITGGLVPALGLELRRGRSFTAGEVEQRAGVVIVSQAVVDRFWPAEDPLGKRLKLGTPEADVPWLEVVGVVGEARLRGLPRNPTTDPDLFLPFGSDRPSFGVVVRGRVSATSLGPAAVAALREVEPQATVFALGSLDERIDAELARPRFAGAVTGLFGAVALLLAAIGVYGVISQAVGQRTREIGLRVALGAAPRAVLAMVLRQGATLATIGLGFGLAVAVAAVRGLESLLFGVSPLDPATLAGGALLLLVAALAAAWLPARRAALVDPVKALRVD